MANIGSGLMEMSLDELRNFPSITKKKKKKNKLTRRRTGKSTKPTGSTGSGVTNESGTRLGTENGRSITRE